MSAWAARGRTCCASGGPSTSTTSGASAESAATRLRAHPGPWCRMPKTWTLTASDDLHAASIEILPAVALLHHGLEVLHPHDAVLDGILHDRTGDPGGEIAGTDRTVA